MGSMNNFPDMWATSEDRASLWLEQAHAAGISLGSIAYGRISSFRTVLTRTHVALKEFTLPYSLLAPTIYGTVKGVPNHLVARHGYTKSTFSFF
jgi:hypothetical protein